MDKPAVELPPVVAGTLVLLADCFWREVLQMALRVTSPGRLAAGWTVYLPPASPIGACDSAKVRPHWLDNPLNGLSGHGSACSASWGVLQVASMG